MELIMLSILIIFPMLFLTFPAMGLLLACPTSRMLSSMCDMKARRG